MRQAGVLDVGCHSALLTVVRAAPGAGLEPVFSRKVRLRLHRTLDDAGRLDDAGVRSVERAVARTRPDASVFAFATSVIRDAPNRDEVIGRVAQATGTRLSVLSGEEEARLAYVAARRWAGPGTGPLLVLDIGGGTVEVAAGAAARPDRALSLPLGARRVTRDRLIRGSGKNLSPARSHLRRALASVPELPAAGPGVRVLACSKTFEQLAALAAADVPGADPRVLTRAGLHAAVRLLARTPLAQRGGLPGISRHRAGQSLAGALVAEALMEACGAEAAEICPWSTREGLLLERLALSRPAAGAYREGPGRG
ncbi:Ppx/GppA phosphatase family protein [Actinacidiphila guanduensis]|uniref:Exopolyphosphatase / guanosine-5'-triphosphate,3'-diphosphate pyrophosphatase n=1 Tax=Actinacidiphila guanduensis TaxID=310781 RepID=A0A1H0R790_9ACTN|nr:hypothetical protein [Actinacidiphila guanduensis]SDP25357.1 exopolyphosphatase / guanosine-5'-triphosphate,3'-diphosphate pyrophosphatase [Actinacidiphila guanduensis]